MSKTVDAFRTISEVAGELDVPKHVLRFWEGKFPQVRPMKRGGGKVHFSLDTEAGEVPRAGDEDRRAVEALSLEIVIPGVEKCGVDRQHLVEPSRLEADLGTGRFLVVELRVPSLLGAQLVEAT